ncbi:GEVED domain-containing protein [Kitasatospora sp. NPDC018058]|uniref:GEVED domain-containing protein n=1 Tax=Kitasatospora sp. NPDC018058 TaxID=3364025 RepID=UPI0037BE527A
MSRQFPRTAAALAVLAAGLLTGLNAPLSVARQFPDAWSGEHRAVLPSGLSVQFDFSASPGVSVTAEPGQLADRSGGGYSATVYADGMRPGSPAQTFSLTQDRPQTDGSWRTVGTLRLSFSRPVRNPRLHLSGLAAVATGRTGTATTAARLTLTGGSPAAPTLVGRTDWPGWTVDAGSLAPSGADGASDGAAGSAAEGTLELTGTVRSAVFRVEQRSTARAGSATAPPVLRQAHTVTVDEDLGTAPQAYGNASHVVSDLFLGADAATPSRRARGRTATTATDGEPMVRLDHGEARRANPFASPYASPPPPELQPGRDEYQGADPSITFPTEAAIGHYYRVTVPVAVSDQPATLAGWIDFDHSGRFDPAGRVQTEIPAGADTATLEWTVPSGAASGETWARLRIGRDTGQLLASGGFADSGQVSDQRIKLTVGAARPEIAAPVDGTVLAGARPEIRGEGAVTGASVEIQDGVGGRAEPGSNVLVTARAGAAGAGERTVLCGAAVALDGSWTCTANRDLTDGEQRLTLTTTDLAGKGTSADPVRVRVAAAVPGPVATDAAAPGPTAASSAAASPAAPGPTVSAPAGPGSATPGPVASVVPSPSVTVPSSPRPTATVTATSAPASAPPSVLAAAGATGSPSPTPATPATPSARPTAPAIPAVSAPPTRSASPPGGRLSASAADQGGSEADRPSARPLPVPPAETESAEAVRGLAGQPREARWPGALAGVLLVLTGFGLITRLVFDRGPGARRR